MILDMAAVIILGPAEALASVAELGAEAEAVWVQPVDPHMLTLSVMCE